MRSEDANDEHSVAYENIRAELDSIASEMDGFDFSSSADRFSNASGVFLTVASVALASGILAALWHLPA